MAGIASAVRRLRRFFADPRPRPKSAEHLAARKAEIEAAHGPWTAHNCRLADDLWTLRPGSVNFDEKTRRCVRIAQDFFGTDLRGLEVLDLGAGEGGLSLELAAQGARVVCVEGRENNIAKASFVADALGLEIEFRCQDVRTLAYDRRFDLVLCFGLLYHLDAASAVRLIQTMGRVTSRLLLLDTHFSLTGPEPVEVDGDAYRGHLVREYAADTSSEAKKTLLWASLDNDTSFWLSRPSLCNALTRAGFNTVYEVAAPLVYDYWDRQTGARVKYRDRSLFVAARSGATPMRTVAAVEAIEPREVPEDIEQQLVTLPPPALR
jgi:SAM-dependent methyltransferase